MTDTKRLEFLMQFFRVEDTGDESVCPGMIVDTDAVSEAFDFGPLADETVTLMDGWRDPDMRRAIDKAISHAANNTLHGSSEAQRKSAMQAKKAGPTNREAYDRHTRMILSAAMLAALAAVLAAISAL